MCPYDALSALRESLRGWKTENVKVVDLRVAEKQIEEFINFEKVLLYLVCGMKGSGKSSFLAYLAEKYYEQGYIIFDAFGEWFENCYWTYMRDKAYDCIFIVPPYKKVEIPDEYKTRIKVMYDDEDIDKILRTASEEKRVIVFVNSCYEDPDEMLRILSSFYDRMGPAVIKLRLKMFMLMREISQQASSGMKTNADSTSTRRSLKKLAATCRHYGISLAADGQLIMDAAPEVRNQAERYVVKKSWPQNLPNDVFGDFLKQIEIEQRRGASIKEWPPVEKMFVQEYYAIYDSGDVVKKSFTMPKFRLKKSGEDYTRMTGVKFETDDEKYKEMTHPQDEKMNKPTADELRTYKQLLYWQKQFDDEGEKYTYKTIAPKVGFETPGALKTWLRRFTKKAIACGMIEAPKVKTIKALDLGDEVEEELVAGMVDEIREKEELGAATEGLRKNNEIAQE